MPKEEGVHAAVEIPAGPISFLLRHRGPPHVQRILLADTASAVNAAAWGKAYSMEYEKTARGPAASKEERLVDVKKTTTSLSAIYDH
jgi:hypothetical protein